MKRQKKDETEENRRHEFCTNGASWPTQGQSAKLVCLVDMSSLEGRLGFELWVRLTWNLHHRLCTALWNYCQNKHHYVHLGEFLLRYLIWGFVCVDSVWSAAHSQPSTLQYPFLVQPESSGTTQPCPTSEPRPPLPGNAHTLSGTAMNTRTFNDCCIFLAPQHV